jgi:predicted ATPase/transcriptional regulator with XRE-family HTH domain
VTTPSEDPGWFGVLLHEYRLAAGLSQEELAERAGLSRRGISDLERGKRRTAHPGTVRRLIEALDLSEPERLALRAAGPHARTRAGPAQDSLAVPANRALERSAGGAVRHNLPIQLTSFVGRQEHREELTRLLATTRLLTLTGAGGVGKTRLAVSVGEFIVDRYANGVWLVELGALADARLVAQNVARTLGVREFPGEPLLSTLTTTLRTKQLLLILDNCEHVLAGCIELAVQVLGACPKVRLMITSREVLGVVGETVWRVQPLSLPDRQGSRPAAQEVRTSEAVNLFMARAEAALPGFTARSQNMAAVAEICRRLDGIPLAIELAAARVRLLALDQLAERLSDRFRLLTTGNSAAPNRQQTLRATLDWSYELLSHEERWLFEVLSVFAGGWSLEAVEAVCGHGGHSHDVVNLLGRLIDKSLVVAESGDRFHLLETVRQYAEERLEAGVGGQSSRRRHAQYVLQLFEQTEDAVVGPTGEVWLNKLEAERDNLRAALSWMMHKGETVLALRLAGAAHRFWYLRGYFTEARGWLNQALMQDAETADQFAHHLSESTVSAASTDATAETQRRIAARAKVLLGIGTLAVPQGDFEVGRQALHESLWLYTELDDPAGAAWVLTILAQEALYRADYENMHRLAAEGVEAGRTAHDPVIVALCRVLRDSPGLPGLAWPGDDLSSERQTVAELVKAAQDTLRASRAIGFRPGECWSLLVLGGLQAASKNYAAARTHWEEATARAREIGFTQVLAPTLTKLGELATEHGETARAGALLGESLQVARELGDRLALANCLEAVAELGAITGKPEQALRIASASAALREAMGAPLSASQQAKGTELLASIRECIDSSVADAAWREGGTVPVDALILDASTMLEEFESLAGR